MREVQINAGGKRFTVSLGDAVTDAAIIQTENADGVAVYEVRLAFADVGGDCAVCLLWHEPMKGVVGYWSPHAGRAHELHQWWAANTQSSCYADGAPVIALFRQGGRNYRTAALSEAVCKTKLSVCVNDFAERESLDLRARIFEEEAPPASPFTFYLRIDESDRNLSRCVGDAGLWWERFYPPRYRPAATDACAAPLFSSWYACHQHPRQAELEKELPLAAELGFGAMIVDDGWSYPGEGTGDYVNCGTWWPDKDKFPDMAAFAAKAKQHGIAPALWFPLPFVGYDNPDFTRFRDMLLCTDDNMKAGVLDVRCPAVRKYLVDTLSGLCETYVLSGLKLDFLNDLTRPAPAPTERCDCETTVEGLRKLLAALDEALEIPQRDLLLEYRQYYLGPAVTRHCNMLRIGDCAFDVISNRIGVIDLRMLRYPLAVHSDMLLWARDEAPETCSVMLLNVLFAVPQVSVLLQYAPPEQLAVLRRFLANWNAHRALLLFGELTVYEPEANYTMVSAEDESLRVTALYGPRVFPYDGKAADAWNATATDRLIFTAEVPGTATCFDCFGNQTDRFSFAPGAVSVRIPRGGMAQLREAQV
ncbi:MAG: alpha-galactosidase [Clostridia bacterium]|nr:alpha-galactosidase [Clostridia bacterium]